MEEPFNYLLMNLRQPEKKVVKALQIWVAVGEMAALLLVAQLEL